MAATGGDHREEASVVGHGRHGRLSRRRIARGHPADAIESCVRHADRASDEGVERLLEYLRRVVEEPGETTAEAVLVGAQQALGFLLAGDLQLP